MWLVVVSAFTVPGAAAGKAGSALSWRVLHPLGNSSELIHMVAEGLPAARENKPRCASPFPVSACVIFPHVPLAPASEEAKAESLLAGPRRGRGYRGA